MFLSVKQHIEGVLKHYILDLKRELSISVGRAVGRSGLDVSKSSSWPVKKIIVLYVPLLFLVIELRWYLHKRTSEQNIADDGNKPKLCHSIGAKSEAINYK